MGIIHVRVDERLIHGQVATVWTNSLGANRIIVVNDAAPKDEMVIGALKMAKPAGVKLSILSTKRAIEKIKAGDYDGDKAFIVTKNIDDAAALVEGDCGISGFNVGNVATREGTTAIKKSVSLTEAEKETLKRLVENGATITAQMLPSESDESIVNFLK